MMRVLLAAALSVSLVGMAAADCAQHIEALWSTVEASDMSDTEKSEVGALLQDARRKADGGDEAGCLEAVEKIRMALNMQ